jgi:putative pyrroloquinoline-quinone-binding quinoprotein
MYNHDAVGTRCNPAEDKLTRDSVRGLKIKWVFPTAGYVYRTPSVVDGTVYVGDTSGTFYTLTSSGAANWMANVDSPITDSALVTSRLVMRIITLIALLPTLIALRHVTAHAHALHFLWSRRVLRLFGHRLALFNELV